MDPFGRWVLVCYAMLPGALLVGRVSLYMLGRHPGLWLRGGSLRQMIDRFGFLWGDDHVALGDPALSVRIWQARFGMALSLVLAMGALRATDPRCLVLW
ncbi:MAG: hypothetical protein Q8L66_15110 [Caulobacter sp.]|nr:hypothetical protein [Caulobacter sp.]